MTHDDIGLDLANIAQSGPTPVSPSEQLREMQEYTPEPTGLFALIARSVLGLEDVVSLILLESEWRSAANSAEAQTYAHLLAQLAEREAALERVRELAETWQAWSSDTGCHKQWRDCRATCADELRAALATAPAGGEA